MHHHQLSRRLGGGGAVLLAMAVVAIAWLAVALTTGTTVRAATGDTFRASVGTGGTQSNATSPVFVAPGPQISDDGRFVVFASSATNLVPGDTNGAVDIFLRDTVANTTTRVSVASDGTQANGGSVGSAISGNGRFVAFDSSATNLVAGDTNGVADIFVYDRVTSTTTRVSLGPAALEANGTSRWPALNADGRYVAFQSSATNLVAGDTNGVDDVFVYDRNTGVTTRESITTLGVQATGGSSQPDISGDGNVVVFQSAATDLVSGDTNGVTDVFARNRFTGVMTRESVSTAGAEADGASADAVTNSDGSLVAFDSTATNLVSGDTNGFADVFLRNRATPSTVRASVGPGGVQGDGSSTSPGLGPDGSFVAFQSFATNLVTDDTNGVADTFVFARGPGTTKRVSVASGGVQQTPLGVDTVLRPDISANGSFVVFSSSATNLVPGDTNGVRDVFVNEYAGGSQPVAPPAPSCDCGGGTVPTTTATTTATATATATASATATATATATASATATSSATATGTSTSTAGVGGTITGGTKPPSSGGFGLFVFGGGTVQQLVDAACPGQGATARFFFLVVPPDPVNPFAPLVPASTVAATNARFNAMFPGGIIPNGTPIIGVCS